MIIDCVADLHGHYPILEGGDLLIVAGDLTRRDSSDEWAEYFLWQGDQNYKKIIFIAGNHDNALEKNDMAFYSPEHKVDYLCDSGTEFCGKDSKGNSCTMKIWGSPWTAQFPGINPKCCAFTMPFGCDTEDHLADMWALIPDDIDILITHSPPYGILDKVKLEGQFKLSEPPLQMYEHVGSKSLYNWLKYVGRPKLHVFGHIHEAYGQVEVFPTYDDKMMISINASHVNERYQPVNKPIRVIL